MPTRSVSPNDQIDATITFDGVGDVGAFDGDTRSITGFSVTNNTNPPAPVTIKVEEEANKQRTFTTVIQPGQTISNNNIPAGQRPQQFWNATTHPARWDGINVYFNW